MPATISTLGQLISLIYLVFDYLGWGPTELGAQGGRPACPPPGPALTRRCHFATVCLSVPMATDRYLGAQPQPPAARQVKASGRPRTAAHQSRAPPPPAHARTPALAAAEAELIDRDAHVVRQGHAVHACPLHPVERRRVQSRAHPGESEH